jgi:hypothetical protein
VERPVEPTRPIRAPAVRQVPAFTVMRERCAYQLDMPNRWSMTTSLPKPLESQPAVATQP